MASTPTLEKKKAGELWPNAVISVCIIYLYLLAAIYNILWWNLTSINSKHAHIIGRLLMFTNFNFRCNFSAPNKKSNWIIQIRKMYKWFWETKYEKRKTKKFATLLLELFEIICLHITKCLVFILVNWFKFNMLLNFRSVFGYTVDWFFSVSILKHRTRN